jgi:hypothetical protein
VRERLRGLAGLPTWAYLAIIVGVSFVLRAWLARGMLGPFIMVDELFYSELAKSFGANLTFAIRDVATTGYGAVYPVLVSPAYAAFERVPDAYAALKTINSLLMSLAAIPAYFLARRVVGRGYALAAAVLAVAVPSMVYTAVVMTENAFYPIFLLAALALVALLERPTAWRIVAFFAVLGVAYFTRTQAVVIAAAALSAPLLLALWRPREMRATLRSYRWLYAVFAGGAVLVVVAQAVRGRQLSDLLGAYSVVGESGYDLSSVLHFVLYHVAELDLYLAVIPYAVAIVLAARARSLDRPLQVLLAVTLSLFAWCAIVVGTFASRFADRIQERNMFVLVPLFLILVLAWAERGATRPRIASVSAAAVSVLLLLAIPFERFVTTSAVSDTLMLLPWWAILDNGWTTRLTLFAFLGGCAFAAAFLVVPARYALVLPAIVLVYWVVALKPIWFGPYPYGFKQAGAGALFQGIRGAPRDWIDRAVPPGREAAVLYTGTADRFTVNMNEFFNRRVGRVYYTTGPSPGGVYEIPVTVDAAGVVRTPDGRPLRPGYLLVDGSVDPNATPVARDAPLGMTVWRVNGPLVLAKTVKTGIYPGDTWSGPRVTWTREHCSGGSLAVSLSGDAQLFPDGNVVTASTGGRARVYANRQSTLRVPLRSRGGRCSVAFTVSPTAVPSEVIPGSTDDRVLGAHFNAFVYAP